MAVSHTTSSVIANRILLALPHEMLKRLEPHLEPADLVRGSVLIRVEEEIEHLYFIEQGMASMVKIMRDGHSVEVAAIGIEGIVGWNAAVSADTANFDNIVQIPGHALRIGAEIFRRFMAEGGPPTGLLHRYSHLIIAQLAQTAACNSLHTLEQRCCRWLLTAHDNARADQFSLTHEFLATMLGYQRAGVTVALGELQKSQLIHYTRGHVAITNRRELEARSCECYAALRAKIEQLFEPQR